MCSNQKRDLAGNKQNMHSRKGFTLVKRMKDFKKNVQVLMSRVHVGSQSAAVNNTSPSLGSRRALCRQSSPHQRYTLDEKKRACFVLARLRFSRLACSNKGTHKLAVNILPFIFSQCSQ
jgi:hypothetical protein